jgi:hypothetical protein
MPLGNHLARLELLIIHEHLKFGIALKKLADVTYHVTTKRRRGGPWRLSSVEHEIMKEVYDRVAYCWAAVIFFASLPLFAKGIQLTSRRRIRIPDLVALWP